MVREEFWDVFRMGIEGESENQSTGNENFWYRKPLRHPMP